MTARPEQRKRSTLIGLVTAAALIVSAAALTAVGTNAVFNSTAGEVINDDARLVLSLPPTDNAALAVVNDDNQLTSLIVATLLPSGQGGSIVTIPVAADVSNGFGDVRQPLDSQLDPSDPTSFFQQVEATLAVTLQFGEIVDVDRLTELLEPIDPVEVDLPVDVIDTSASGAGLVAEAGVQQLEAPLLAQVLQAVDDDANERTQHSIDVAAWTGVGAASPADGKVEAPVDDVGRPASSVTIDEVFTRLWSGPVQVRDISLVAPTTAGIDTGVLLDRRDVVLVFSQISPARVSTPNPGPVFRLEIPISAAQLEASGSGLESRREVGLSVIGQLLLVQANVASVDATASPDGAAAVTRIAVANEDFIEPMEELGPRVFGEVDVVLAEILIDGIDATVRVGTGYLDLQAAESVASVTDAGGSDASTPDGAATVEADG